jgi:hypothetical protein
MRRIERAYRPAGTGSAGLIVNYRPPTAWRIRLTLRQKNRQLFDVFGSLSKIELAWEQSGDPNQERRSERDAYVGVVHSCVEQEQEISQAKNVGAQ